MLTDLLIAGVCPVRAHDRAAAARERALGFVVSQSAVAVPVGALPSGAHFRLSGFPEKHGALVRVGAGSAVVRYYEPRHVELPNGRVFEARAGGVTISLGTLVIPESD